MPAGVTLGSLIFFSTDNGDAWVLDFDDRLALCLALEGKAQPYRIVETDTRFAIEWNAKYASAFDSLLPSWPPTSAFDLCSS